jgi:hypothetical protein
MFQLTPPFRRARPDDAQALAELVDFASEGLALYVWGKIAGPGGDPWAVGRERALRPAAFLIATPSSWSATAASPPA